MIYKILKNKNSYKFIKAFLLKDQLTKNSFLNIKKKRTREEANENKVKNKDSMNKVDYYENETNIAFPDSSTSKTANNIFNMEEFSYLSKVVKIFDNEPISLSLFGLYCQIYERSLYVTNEAYQMLKIIKLLDKEIDRFSDANILSFNYFGSFSNNTMRSNHLEIDIIALLQKPSDKLKLETTLSIIRGLLPDIDVRFTEIESNIYGCHIHKVWL